VSAWPHMGDMIPRDFITVLCVILCVHTNTFVLLGFINTLVSCDVS